MSEPTTQAPMVDTRLVYFRMAAAEIVPESINGQSLRWTVLSAFHSAEFLAEHGEGWVPVSHQLTPLSDAEVLLSVLLRREVSVDFVATAEEGR